MMAVHTDFIRLPSLICTGVFLLLTFLLIIRGITPVHHIEINNLKIIDLRRLVLGMGQSGNKTMIVSRKNISKHESSEYKITNTQSDDIRKIGVGLSRVPSHKRVELSGKLLNRGLYQNRVSMAHNVLKSTNKKTVTSKTSVSQNSGLTNVREAPDLEKMKIKSKLGLLNHKKKDLKKKVVPVVDKQSKGGVVTHCVQHLPSCVIIGIQKCGTKALAEFLKIHPNISVDSRQTYFFSQYYQRGLAWYKSQMPCSSKHTLTLERTPQYFYFKDVPKRIYDMNKSVKLLIIVRDPVTRAVSNFAMAKDRKRAEDTKTFEECVLKKEGGENRVNSSCKYVQKSNYPRYMKHWLDVFSLEQIHVANGDRLVTDPVTELAKIETFLKIPHFISLDNFVINTKTGFNCLRNVSSTDMNCLSRKKGRTHPAINHKIILKLEEYFKPLNQIFYRMIGQTFEW